MQTGAAPAGAKGLLLKEPESALLLQGPRKAWPPLPTHPHDCTRLCYDLRKSSAQPRGHSQPSTSRPARGVQKLPLTNASIASLVLRSQMLPHMIKSWSRTPYINRNSNKVVKVEASENQSEWDTPTHTHPTHEHVYICMANTHESMCLSVGHTHTSVCISVGHTLTLPHTHSLTHTSVYTCQAHTRAYAYL